MKRIIYELRTSSGSYEDYREHIVFRNEDEKIVKRIKDKLEKQLNKIKRTPPKEVTVDDIALYNVGSDELDNDKYILISNWEENKYKINDLSELTIVSVIINTNPNMKNMLEQLGIEI